MLTYSYCIVTLNLYNKMVSGEVVHVMFLATIIQNRLHTGKEACVAFVEFSKAFDSVNIIFLLHKLLNYNINGTIYMAIQRLYCNTQNYMRINIMYTQWFLSYYGVRQVTLCPQLYFQYF